MTHSPPPQPEALTSTRSPTVARLRRLHERKGRKSAGAFLAEGPDCVRAAVTAGWATMVLATHDQEPLDWARASGVQVTLALPKVVDAASDTTSPQGILAECTLPRSDLGAVLAAPGPVVVCDRIADPGNLGTIIRTAEAVGAAGVITTEGSVDPWNPKSVRASAGSSFRLPIAADRPISDVLSAAGDAQRWSVALAGSASMSVLQGIEDARVRGFSPDRLVWVVGAEAHGVSTVAREGVDATAHLPMRPEVESLNAAVSVAVCLYAAQWAGEKS